MTIVQFCWLVIKVSAVLAAIMVLLVVVGHGGYR
jgi:hypothetical protein